MQRTNAAFPQTIDQRQRLVALVDRYGSRWMACLLFTYFLFCFVGIEPTPLSHGVGSMPTQLSHGASAQTAGGTSVVRQILIIGLFCGSLPILFVYRRRLADVLRTNILPLSIYAWLATTALWSMHPPLTLRRIIAETLLLAMVAATTCAMRSWRVIVYPVAAAAVVVIISDILAVILVPGMAIGPIGALGLHSNKNTAGAVTLIALILCGGSFLACRNWRIRAGLVPVILLGFVFIFLTKSKTSLGLVAVIYAAFPAFYLFFKRWSAAPAVVPVLLVSAVAFIVLLVGIAGYSRDDVFEFVFGDATLTLRTELWAYLQGNIDRHPYLGAGWGAFWETGSPINPINAPPQSWVLRATEINTAHSGYMDMWLQAGLVGLLLLAATILRAIWVYANLLRQRHWNGEEQRLIATMFAVILALALYNFLESLLFHPADCMTVLFMLALFTGETLYRQTRRIGSASPRGVTVPSAVAPLAQLQPHLRRGAAASLPRSLPPTLGHRIAGTGGVQSTLG